MYTDGQSLIDYIIHLAWNSNLSHCTENLVHENLYL